MPKKEPPAVTIANQEIQIKNLLQRIEDLASGRNEAVRQRLEFERKAEEVQRQLLFEQQWRKADVDRLEETHALLAKSNTLLEGYRMAIMDINGGKA